MHHSSSHPDPTPHLDTVHQIGMMLAQAVFHGDNISIRLAPSLLKQVRESMTMCICIFCMYVHTYTILDECSVLYKLNNNIKTCAVKL